MGKEEIQTECVDKLNNVLIISFSGMRYCFGISCSACERETHWNDMFKQCRLDIEDSIADPNLFCDLGSVTSLKRMFAV